MRLQYFVTKADSGEQVLIAMEPAMKNDLEATKNGWQSDWTSDFISDPRLKSMQPKQKLGRSLHWEPTGKMTMAFLFLSQTLRHSRRATRRLRKNAVMPV